MNMTPEDQAYAVALAEAVIKQTGASSGVRVLAHYALYLKEQSERSICFRVKAFLGRLKSPRLTP